MVLFIGFCWVFIRARLFCVIRFLNRCFFRFQFGNSSKKDDSHSDALNLKEDEIDGAKENSRCSDHVREAIEFADSKYDVFGEKESSSSFTFKFQFQSPEDIRRSIEESDAHLSEEQKFTTCRETSKYHFLADNDIAGFTEEPEVMSFSIRGSSVDSEGETSGTKDIPNIEFEEGFLFEQHLKHENLATEAPREELLKKPCDAVAFKREEETENSEDVLTTVLSEIHTLGVKDMPDEVILESEKEFSGFDSEPESISLSDGLSVVNPITDSERNDFVSDTDFEGGRGFGRESEWLEYMQNQEANRWWNSFTSDAESFDLSSGFSPINSRIDIYKLYLSDTESLDFSEESSSVMNRFDGSVLSSDFLSEKDFLGSEHDTDDSEGEKIESREELQESEHTHLANSQIPEEGTSDENQTSDSNQSDGFLSEKDFVAPENELKGQDGKSTETIDGLRESDETQMENTPSNSDSDDSDGLESLWEHQDLIEQLRMEIRKVRATGLPTILEESESPKMIDDLKPWTIDEKFLQEDPLDEMQKFYKSYRERMRKLDILNFQKMYAIGFLQLKDPLQSISHRKNSTPTFASLLSQNIRRRRHRKPDADPTAKFIEELQSDLEMIYVGQACLSWEFLQWQYEKSGNLLESDAHECRHYNQVAGEFQQFQVLLQRFLENEPFQGPRVQAYVKTRCIRRNLLQVPVVKEDCFKGRMEESRRGDGAIRSEMLTTIMEESMRIFWEFIKADKDENNVILKGFSRTQIKLQDPADSQLLLDIQVDLQKRERKLKELLRTGNCLVKKFQKPREDRRSVLELFFSQVDLKLVSRVLKMSRLTTDQLLWCQKILNKFTFHDRKLHREPSFLPFPC